jgi:hypothetical protein
MWDPPWPVIFTFTCCYLEQRFGDWPMLRSQVESLFSWAQSSETFLKFFFFLMPWKLRYPLPAQFEESISQKLTGKVSVYVCSGSTMSSIGRGGMKYSWQHTVEWSDSRFGRFIIQRMNRWYTLNWRMCCGKENSLRPWWKSNPGLPPTSSVCKLIRSC